MFSLLLLPIFFFFNDTAPTEIYTLSLHDALPICAPTIGCAWAPGQCDADRESNHRQRSEVSPRFTARSEEHTSELQSHVNLVCRLLLEKKKKKKLNAHTKLIKYALYQLVTHDAIK